MRPFVTPALASAIALLSALPLHAQGEPPANPLIRTVHDGAGYIRTMFLTAADQLSDEDYAFRPTPEVRSFGALLAHVADSNFLFCSRALGEAAPASGIERSRTTRAEIQQSLTQSFDYCDDALRRADTRPETTVDFMGTQRSPMAVLNFRTYHALLHYGNVITYMRLRGKVPPSSQQVEGG